MEAFCSRPSGQALDGDRRVGETFTVVQWDQRGAARTLGRNGSGIASSITVERLTQDGLELSEWLRANLAVEKIILVGHSWGSTLGVLMAKARPDLFHAFVGTGQVADPPRRYGVAYAALLSKAEASGADQAIAELREVGPPPYPNGRGNAVQRKWANLFEGADVFVMSMLGLALTAPGYTYKDVMDWFEGQGVSADQLMPQTSRLSTDQLAGDFRVPIFVFQGAEDFTTPTRLAPEYVESLRAPVVVAEAVGARAAQVKPNVVSERWFGVLAAKTGNARLFGSSRGRSAVKHARDADILVYFRPMDALAATDETEVLSLGTGRVRKTPRPSEWNADRSAVGQDSRDLVVSDPNGSDVRLRLGYSARARHWSSYPSAS